jgi:hypothetical protein
MIHVDTSVVLVQVFAEERVPPTSLWNELLVSSRLLEYEVWNRARLERSPRLIERNDGDRLIYTIEQNSRKRALVPPSRSTRRVV